MTPTRERHSIRTARRYVRQTHSFIRDYTDGLNIRDVQRMFDRDASEAYSVLSRDRQDESEPSDKLRKFLYRIKVVFLGLSTRLTPARRLLFAVSLLSALAALVSFTVSFGEPPGQVATTDLSWIFFLLSIAGLLYLFAIELVDRVRVRDELEVARQLQRDLLPGSDPGVPGYEIFHSYRTANDIGGDYYDFQVLDDGRLAVLVGDASGHGIAAGLLMAISNATLKTAMDIDPSPVRVASLLNRTLFRTGDRRAFMTLFYGLLEPATGRFEYICCGHPFPLLLSSSGELVELGSGSLPLGLREQVEIESDEVSLQTGDLLLLYTDGLPEAVGRTREESFGFERLRRLFSPGGDPRCVHDRILQGFDQHVEGQPLADDLTLIVLRRTPE